MNDLQIILQMYKMLNINYLLKNLADTNSYQIKKPEAIRVFYCVISRIFW